MTFSLEPVSRDQKEILRNLLEKYLYEFSQYDGQTPGNQGLYGYDWLDCYWTEANRWAFFLRVDGALAGFAMVHDYPEGGVSADYCMSEFFVLLGYRRSGLGSWAASTLFQLFRGEWQLKYHPRNLPSARFWERLAAAASRDGVRRSESPPGSEYADGTPGVLLQFFT